MSVQDKRDRVNALKAQIEARKASLGAETQVANDVAREAVLDREIERLEGELAAIDALAAPTGEVSVPVVAAPEPTPPPEPVPVAPVPDDKKEGKG